MTHPIKPAKPTKQTRKVPTVTVTTRITTEYQLPPIPLALIGPDGRRRPIEEFSEAQLDEIGARWTQVLKGTAVIRRGNAISKLNREIHQIATKRQ